MSRILFICSGNTCRSPMAAAIATRIFGPSHTIASAGAETGSDLPAAGNAVIAMSKMELNISSHKTVDITDLDLANFDIIVVFRPSSAESMSFPANAELVYLDIPDPYGRPLMTYMATARRIERAVRRLYAEDALRRTSTFGNTSGSHVAGVFNRAAKEFEKEVGVFAVQQLSLSVRKKATLGELGIVIDNHARAHSLPRLHPLVNTIAEVNDYWVRVKHQEDPPVEDLVAGLSGILRGFDLVIGLS